MQFTNTISLASLLLIRLAAALSLSDVPQCAVDEALASLGDTGCDISDFTCVCKHHDWLQSLVPKVRQDCGDNDVTGTFSPT